MPKITPTSAQDCINFIESHRSEIEKGVYDIEIGSDWIPHLPEKVLLFLAQYSLESSWTLASSLHISKDVIEVLSKNEYKYDTYVIREKIAKNPNTPAPILERLAKDGDSIRLAVAENPNTPASVLAVLANDETYQSGYRTYVGYMIPARVAGNPNTPPSTLEILARNQDKRVSHEVAKNPKLPPSVLDVLIENKELSGILARNPNIPTSALKVLAKDDRYGIRIAVAENPKTPSFILEELAKDEYPQVVQAVEKNPNTPENVVKRLEKENNKSCFIATACYGSYDAPEVIIFRIYRDKYLSRSLWGRLFIKGYYTYSPYIASIIKNKPIVKALVKKYILNNILKYIHKE